MQCHVWNMFHLFKLFFVDDSGLVEEVFELERARLAQTPRLLTLFNLKVMGYGNYTQLLIRSSESITYRLPSAVTLIESGRICTQSEQHSQLGNVRGWRLPHILQLAAELKMDLLLTYFIWYLLWKRCVRKSINNCIIFEDHHFSYCSACVSCSCCQCLCPSLEITKPLITHSS